MKNILISISFFIILAAACLFVFMTHRTYDFTMDDSFIAFRYASHLANGNGLVWNVGEKIPNEGYTSFLWVAVLALTHKFGADLVTASKLIGILFTLFTACVCFWSVYRVSDSTYPAPVRLIAGAATTLFLLANVNLSSQVISGMDTSISLFLSTFFFASTAFYLKAQRPPGIKAAFVIGILAVLSGLSRPEFNLSAAAALLAMICIFTPQRKFAVYALSVYAVCGLIYFIWHYNYFGLLVPLSFYIKQLGMHQSHFPDFPVVVYFIKSLWPLYLFLGFFALSIYKENKNWLPALIGVAINIIYFTTPKHEMGVNFRFLFPIYPALTIFSGLGVLKLWHILKYRARIYTATTAAVCLIFCFCQIGEHSTNDMRGYASDHKAHIALGRILAEIDPKGEKVLAIAAGGMVPYYSNWNTIDTFGLTNREIAIMRSKDLYDAGMIMSKYKPDILVLLSTNRNNYVPYLTFEKSLYDESLKLNYRNVGALEFDSNNYYLWIMTRDVELFDILKNKIS